MSEKKFDNLNELFCFFDTLLDYLVAGQLLAPQLVQVLKLFEDYYSLSIVRYAPISN